MAVDPVCKMSVEPAKAAAQSNYKGQTYYFCAAGCKQKFDREPEKYLAGGKSDMAGSAGGLAFDLDEGASDPGRRRDASGEMGRSMIEPAVLRGRARYERTMEGWTDDADGDALAHTVRLADPERRIEFRPVTTRPPSYEIPHEH